MEPRQPLLPVTEGLSTACFLHIGKTGGSGMRDYVKSVRARSRNWRLAYRGHGFNVEAIMQESDPQKGLVFFVRDPVSRFISGFNSRKRRGYPRYEKSYTRGEVWAFARFDTPEALGLGLADGNEDAALAWQRIVHVKRGLAWYLQGVEILERYKDRILFVGQTETYDADLEAMKRRFGLPSDIAAPQDALGKFTSPPGEPTVLSPRAREAVVAHMAPDYAVYGWALGHRARILAADDVAAAKWNSGERVT